MIKINIGGALKNGFKVLVEHPILMALGVIVNFPMLFDVNKDNVLAIIGTGILVTIYMIGLSMRFIYESRETTPSWPQICKFVGQRYGYLLLMGLIVYAALFLGAILLVIPAIYLGIKFLFADCGILFENEKVGPSLTRSWRMTRGNWWRLLAVYFVAYSPFVLTMGTEKVMPRLAYMMMSLLVGSFVFAWTQAIFTLAYLELRKGGTHA